MRRTVAGTVLLGTLVVSLLGGGGGGVGVVVVANANPGTGSGFALFHCQIVLAFPAPAPSATKTNCDGGANGALLGTGKTDLYVSTGTSSLVNKGYQNFRAYNIVYNEVCPVPNVPFPPAVGQASGDVTIQGTGLFSGAPAYVHSQFVYTRVGATFVALLNGTHAHNGTASTGHVGTGSGSGVAVGVFGVKGLPIGDCATPNPEQEITIDGILVGLTL